MSTTGDVEAATASATGRRHIPTTANTFDVEIDEDNLPELSSYLSEGKFWWKFVAWPLVFVVINGVVFGTLVMYDEHNYRYRREREMFDDYRDRNSSDRHINTYLGMLRYNATVFAIILFLDAGLLYFAAKFVEKDVTALDALLAEEDSSHAAGTPNRLNGHVHAQVSRRLDAILGRGASPRDSIVISVLFLGSTICASFAIMSVVDWTFTWTPTAGKVCVSPWDNGYSERTARERDENMPDVPGIPQDLQRWAKDIDEWEYYGGRSGTDIVRLEDGTSYFVAAEPNMTADADPLDRYDSPWNYQSSEPVLVAISADGTIDFLSNVTRPQSFVVPANTDMLHAATFCCLYSAGEESRRYSSASNLLCVDSTGLHDATLDQQKKEGKSQNHRSNRNLMFSSVRWYKNCVWLKLFWETNLGVNVEYFNVTIEDGKPLNLVPVYTTGHSGGDNMGHASTHSMIGGEARSCRHWRKYIGAAVVVATFAPAAFWLRQVRNLAVGVVPAVGALAALLYCISNDLAMAVCIVVAVASFLTSQGCTVPLMTALRSEELVWVLYASIVAAVNHATRQPEESVGIALLICVVVGSVLGHPALYLVGWIGGIGLFLGSGFAMLLHPRLDALFYMAAGIIGGVGCVTVGKLMMKYQAYLSYWAKRVFRAINTGMQSVAPNNVPRQGQGSAGSTITAGLLGHAN